MIGEGIQEDVLRALVAQHAVREVVVGRVRGEACQWSLSVRLGSSSARLIPVRSRRETLRTWMSLAIGPNPNTSVRPLSVRVSPAFTLELQQLSVHSVHHRNHRHCEIDQGPSEGRGRFISPPSHLRRLVYG
ncbi:MAG: hypothetical protein ACRES5_10595 [Pseudomonas sp.]